MKAFRIYKQQPGLLAPLFSVAQRYQIDAARRALYEQQPGLWAPLLFGAHRYQIDAARRAKSPLRPGHTASCQIFPHCRKTGPFLKNCPERQSLSPMSDSPVHSFPGLWAEFRVMSGSCRRAKPILTRSVLCVPQCWSYYQ